MRLAARLRLTPPANCSRSAARTWALVQRASCDSGAPATSTVASPRGGVASKLRDQGAQRRARETLKQLGQLKGDDGLALPEDLMHGA